MVGQNTQVKHVRVGQEKLSLPPDMRALLPWRVPVEYSGSEAQAIRHLLQPRQLVLGQRLGGKQVQHPARTVVQKRLYGGNVVAEAFTACRRRGHHHVGPAS